MHASKQAVQREHSLGREDWPVCNSTAFDPAFANRKLERSRVT